jgi:hypothetical protein
MFLDFEFDPLPMSIKHVSLVLMAVVLSSLLLPGLVAASKRTDLIGWVLIAHSVGVNVIELQLHCQVMSLKIYRAGTSLCRCRSQVNLADHFGNLPIPSTLETKS